MDEEIANRIRNYNPSEGRLDLCNLGIDDETLSRIMPRLLTLEGLQDLDLSGDSWGYSNNQGDMATEGFIGIGITHLSDDSYNPFNLSFPINSACLVVLNIVDPVNVPSCNYSLMIHTVTIVLLLPRGRGPRQKT